MDETLSDRRLAENEAFFKEANERLAKGFKELDEVAQAEGQEEWAVQAKRPLEFYCECSDEKCRKRLQLEPDEYLDLHKQANYFIVLPGHNEPRVERIVRSEKNYLVVEKYFEPPASDHLNPTDLNNA